MIFRNEIKKSSWEFAKTWGEAYASKENGKIEIIQIFLR